MTKYSGKYICVVEGSIQTRDKGVYMKLAGRPAMEVLADVGGKAAAIVAIGSCASWGGIPSADPDPTGAVGVADLLPNRTFVNLPGCPPNPYTLLGVLLQFADSGTLPEMDAERRPKFAYDRDIHEHALAWRTSMPATSSSNSATIATVKAGVSTKWDARDLRSQPRTVQLDLFVIADAVHPREEETPGTLCVYCEDDLGSSRAQLRLTSHDPGVQESLAQLRLAGHAPSEVIVVGVVRVLRPGQ